MSPLERLESLNARLDLLRLQIRLLHSFQLIDDRRYEHVACLVEEVGRQLGAGSTSSGAGPPADAQASTTAAVSIPASRPSPPSWPRTARPAGASYRPDALAFGANLEAELFQLQHELPAHAPGAYRQFMVREPKPRLVSAAPFRDRVVHHALIAVIAPPLERHFIPTSYANRKGYGTHRALRRFHRACREHSWVLQVDIRLYFPSIDHRLLQAQLEQLIACPGTHWLLTKILANGASDGPAIDAFPGDTLLTPLERPRACRSAISPASFWPICISTPSITACACCRHSGLSALCG